MRLSPGGIAACCLLLPTLATARPLTVDDALHFEELGPTIIDPTGRWAVIETELPHDESPRFEDWAFSRNVRARLTLVDLATPTQSRPAFPQEKGAGYIADAFSPSGRYLLVFRDVDRHREAGVVTLATGQVRWLGVGADMGDWGPTAVWRSDNEILMLAMEPGARTYQDEALVAATADLPGLWNDALQGRAPTAVSNGSGRFKDLHPVEPDRRLLRIDVTTGVATTLATGDLESLSLAPGGQRLAVVEALERIQPQAEVLRGPGTEWRRHNILVIDLPNGRPLRPCPDCDVMRGSLRWSPQGRLLLFTKANEQAWNEGQFLTLEPKSATLQPMATVDVAPSFSYVHSTIAIGVHADWLGEDPILFGTTRAAGRDPSRPDWYRLSPDGAHNLTASLPSPPSSIEAITGGILLLKDGDAVWSVTSRGDARKLYTKEGLTSLPSVAPYTTVKASLDTPSSRVSASVYSVGPGGVTAADVGPSGARWSATAPFRSPSPTHQVSIGSTNMPGDIRPLAKSSLGLLVVSRDSHGVQHVDLVRSGARNTNLLTLNPQLSAVDAAPPIAIDDPGPHGEAYKDYLYLPADAKPGVRLPMVVIPYPGFTFTAPSYQGLPGVLPLDDNIQVVAGHGYAVLRPSIPIDPESVDYSAGLTQAVLHAVDLAAKTGLIDPDRTALWGHSAGGYMALVVATRTDRFKAIISAAAPADLISFRGQTRPSLWLGSNWPVGVGFAQGWTELGQSHLMATPYTGLDRYLRSSPIFSADKVKTPLLLVQGDQDFISYEQGQEMFAALYRLRKDAILMSFFGEGHSVMSPPNARAYMSAAFRFLDANLKPPPSTVP